MTKSKKNIKKNKRNSLNKLKFKNQIGGMFQLGDRVRESDTKEIGTIINIGQSYDPFITMRGDNGLLYIHHSPHYRLLSSEDERVKKWNDDEREQIKERNKQRDAQAIINARLRNDFFEGDRVRESESNMTGTVINPIDQFGNVLMKGDDGKNYSCNKWRYILLETEKMRMELEKEEAKRLAEKRKTSN
jgi:hypothetical protein